MSSELARWYHSMTFTYANEWNDENKKHGTVNTWDDWHLVPTSRPLFNPPNVKTVYIDIPGADGKLDLTESLSGYPNLENRTGSMEFIVMNGYRQNWSSGYSRFMNWLHGKNLRCVLDDDRSYYYEGRFTISEWNSNNDGTWSNVTIDYDVKPYKYYHLLSTEPWKWDPFNFETDVIFNVKDIPIDAGLNKIVVHNTRMHVIPTFKIKSITTTMTIELNGRQLIFNETKKGKGVNGDFRDPRLELLEGDNEISIMAHNKGTISVEFRSGSL